VIPFVDNISAQQGQTTEQMTKYMYSDGRFRNFYTRFDLIFFKNLDFELRAIFTSISRLVHIAQSVAAGTINVANLV